MTSRSMPSGFLKSVLQNGVGRYICQLKRITFQFCKFSGKSKGVRDFIESDLIDFARKNPGVVVYVTPHQKYAKPTVVAEYLNGNTSTVDVFKMPRDELTKQVDLLRAQSGLDVVRMRKPMHTDNPTIQGLWNPFTNKPTHLNVETFPTKDPTWKYAEKKPTLRLDDTPESGTS